MDPISLSASRWFAHSLGIWTWVQNHCTSVNIKKLINTCSIPQQYGIIESCVISYRCWFISRSFDPSHGEQAMWRWTLPAPTLSFCLRLPPIGSIWGAWNWAHSQQLSIQSFRWGFNRFSSIFFPALHQDPLIIQPSDYPKNLSQLGLSEPGSP